jgi:hypothetical protein
LVSVVTASSAASSNAVKLKGYNADKNDASVSGLSSGAFMTTQLHVAYSSMFKKGAGIIAGGPYFCVESYEDDPSKYLLQATSTCMNPLTISSAPDGKGLFTKAAKLAKQKKIDPVENLKGSKIYLFSRSSENKHAKPE